MRRRTLSISEVTAGLGRPVAGVVCGSSLRLVSTYRHLNTQDSHGAQTGPELEARRSAVRAAYHAKHKKILRAAVARAVIGSRLLYGASTRHSLSATNVDAMEDTHTAPFRTIANEKWRPGHIRASSQEVCRRSGDFQEAVRTQRLRLAARIVDAALSVMALRCRPGLQRRSGS